MKYKATRWYGLGPPSAFMFVLVAALTVCAWITKTSADELAQAGAVPYVPLSSVNLDMYVCQIAIGATGTFQSLEDNFIAACESKDWLAVSDYISSVSDLPHGHSHDEFIRKLRGEIACAEIGQYCSGQQQAEQVSFCTSLIQSCNSSDYALAGHYLTKLERSQLQLSALNNATVRTQVESMEEFEKHAASYCAASNNESDSFWLGSADGGRTSRMMLQHPELHQNVSQLSNHTFPYLQHYESLLHCLCHPDAGDCLPHSLALANATQALMAEILHPTSIKLNHANTNRTDNAILNSIPSRKRVSSLFLATQGNNSLHASTSAFHTATGDDEIDLDTVLDLAKREGAVAVAPFIKYLIDASGVNQVVKGLSVVVNTKPISTNPLTIDYVAILSYVTPPLGELPLSMEFAVSVEFPNQMIVSGWVGVCLSFLKEFKDTLSKFMKGTIRYVGTYYIIQAVNWIFGLFGLDGNGCWKMLTVQYDILRKIFLLQIGPFGFNLYVIAANARAYYQATVGTTPVVSTVGFEASFGVDILVYSNSWSFTPTYSWNGVDILNSVYSTSAVTIHQSFGVDPAVVPFSQYLGCYSDNSQSPTLSTKAPGSGYTAQTCSSAAVNSNSGAKYFGLENGADCYYGASMQSSTISSACQSVCSADTSHNSRCGGPSALDVYQIVGTPSQNCRVILQSGQSLSAGVPQSSPRSTASMVVDATGNLVINYAPVPSAQAAVVFRTTTANSQASQAGSSLVAHPNCNVCLQSPDGTWFRQWCTWTHNMCTSFVEVCLYDTGMMIVRDQTSKQLLWRSGVVIPPGQVIYFDGRLLMSTSGAASLNLQTDGGLVARNGNGQITFTPQTAGGFDWPSFAWVNMQSDCNLCVYSPSGSVLWCSGTQGHGTGCYATLSDDGIMSIIDSVGNTVWQPGVALATGQALSGTMVIAKSPQGQATLSVVGGNLQLAVGSTVTFSVPSVQVSMQTDCNLCTYDSGGNAQWCSHSNGLGTNCQLRINDCGGMQIVDGNGRMLWPPAQISEVNPSYSFCSSSPAILHQGGVLDFSLNQVLYSASGLSRLTATNDGRLQLIGPQTSNPDNAVTFSLVNQGTDQFSVLRMQSDCNLCLYTKSGATYWCSRSQGLGSNCALTVSECGNMVITNDAGNVVWSGGETMRIPGCYSSALTVLRTNTFLRFRGTPPNDLQALYSPSRAYRLVAQQDGNLCLRFAEWGGLGFAPIWCANTQGANTDYVIMQSDCNLCVYAIVGNVGQQLWCSGTQNLGTSCQLEINNCGVMYITNGNGDIVWTQGVSNDVTQCGSLDSGDTVSLAGLASSDTYFDYTFPSIASPSGGSRFAFQGKGVVRLYTGGMNYYSRIAQNFVNDLPGGGVAASRVQMSAYTCRMEVQLPNYGTCSNLDIPASTNLITSNQPALADCQQACATTNGCVGGLYVPSTSACTLKGTDMLSSPAASNTDAGAVLFIPPRNNCPNVGNSVLQSVSYIQCPALDASGGGHFIGGQSNIGLQECMGLCTRTSGCVGAEWIDNAFVGGCNLLDGRMLTQLAIYDHSSPPITTFFPVGYSCPDAGSTIASTYSYASDLKVQYSLPSNPVSAHDCSLAVSDCGIAYINSSDVGVVAYIFPDDSFNYVTVAPSNRLSVSAAIQRCNMKMLPTNGQLLFNNGLGAQLQILDPPSNSQHVQESLSSPSGTFFLVAQWDGNLCLYGPSKYQTFWCAGTQGQNAANVVMQSDCNLCVYSKSGSALWCSMTQNRGNSCALFVSDCGVVYIRDPQNGVVWSQGISGIGDPTSC